MITGFLFWSRLIRNRDTHFDWFKLYISRILRLTPLYFFVISILLFIVAIKTNFTIKEKPTQILTEIVKWYSFSIGDGPNINGLKDISIICGVIWTLPYVGEMSYSLYLIHPLLLFLLFKFLIPQNMFSSSTDHWLIIILLTPILIILCSFTYKNTEYPFIKWTARAHLFMKSILGSKKWPWIQIIKSKVS